jgi:phosphatidylserine decarboxylase
MRIPVAREGWPFVLVPAAIAAALALAGRRMPAGRALAAPFAAASLAALGFFRDPEREVPSVPGGVLAPADGRVRAVEDIDDPFVGPAVRVSIFLSPLDVHVNRAPIAGAVVGTVYTPGHFVPAWRSDADEINERCAIHLAGREGRVTVTQIAGIAARRIVCRVGEGDTLEAGERFGMIRFGSRTDCAMPRAATIKVRPGDHVTGGVTLIGLLP